MGMLVSGNIPNVMKSTRRVLFLYDHHWTHVKTIQHFLQSFHRFSRHQVSYVTSLSRCPVDLDYFDAVVLHYSVRLCYAGHLSPAFHQALRDYHGVKAIFLQDEYENTHRTWEGISKLGINLVFTVVPQESIAKVYPPERFPGTRFVNVLTGYVPLDVQDIPPGPPLATRKILIGYRGRDNGFWYGDLPREKVEIGKRMKEVCAARGLPCDIAWDESSRIYGDNWFRFMGECRATLGTESGSNIFDYDGTLALRIQKEQAANPAITYAEIRAKYLADREGEVVMNQISPRIFEAVACRTALVLYEGRYSDVLQPHRHFLPLKKDLSNVDEVLLALNDIPRLEAMVERAYDEVVLSGKWAYSALVNLTDRELESGMSPKERADTVPWLPLPPCDANPAFRKQYAKNWEKSFLKRFWHLFSEGRREAIRNRMKRCWNCFPSWMKSGITPLINRVRVSLKGNR